VSELYGVWGEKRFMGRTFMGVNRTTFVIGPDGQVAAVFEKVNPLGHAKAVAHALEALR
jgi:peroxiredoxin Q/BCP